MVNIVFAYKSVFNSVKLHSCCNYFNFYANCSFGIACTELCHNDDATAAQAFGNFK